LRKVHDDGMRGEKDPTIPGRRRVFALTAAAIAAVAGLAVLFTALNPSPPRSIVMATGSPDSAYYQLGERYRSLLARHGVELRLLQTAGSIENLARLQDLESGVSVAFVQGGLTSAEQSPGLLSLGTMFYEPLWVFHRDKTAESRDVSFLAGRRLSIGPPGSGANAMGRQMIELVGLSARNVQILELRHADAKAALQRGEIDAMFMVAPWENAIVQELLKDPAIVTGEFQRGDAIVALTPNLRKVVVPRGVADLANDLPPNDLTLIANVGSLVVRDDLHPALQYLLLDVASRVHSAPGVFDRGRRFPAAEAVDLPLSNQARYFYQSGRPFLQRYLPFWLAMLAERLLFVVIPVVGIIYPVARFLPGFYGWSMRRRIYRLYGELKFLEADLERRDPGRPVDDIDARLTDLEHRANSMRVPVTFAHVLYELRLHIGLVRSSIAARAPVDQFSSASL
jgi:TRAP transporter TAXI family solute receptor